MSELIIQIKESIGLPFQINPLPSSFTIKTPYFLILLRQLSGAKLETQTNKVMVFSKIDPTRVIFRLDISRDGISKSERTFNPADISALYVSKDILPDGKDGEIGYKSL